MPRKTYDAFCPECALEWNALDADDSGLKAGEALALCTCARCEGLWPATVRQPTRELRRLRRQHLKAIQKICQSFVRAQNRLQERRKALAREIAKGNTEHVDAVREIEARLASLVPPDTSSLEARARELEQVAQQAPKESEAPRCPECAGPGAVHRESHRGFEVPCPSCGHRLIVRMRIGR